MPTIRIATGCTLQPARILRAAYDFGPDRTRVWPAVRAEHLTVHELSETTADATEGTPAGIGINWERCHYDWSQPGRVTATVTGSNVYAHPGSSWQLTATPSKRGSRVEMVWQRTFRRNPRGLFFGTCSGSPAARSSAATPGRSSPTSRRSNVTLSPHQMARRPSARNPQTMAADQRTRTASSACNTCAGQLVEGAIGACPSTDMQVVG